MIVYVVVDDALSPDFPLGDSLEVFIRREDAERFIEEVRGDELNLATALRIEERELEVSGRSEPSERDLRVFDCANLSEVAEEGLTRVCIRRLDSVASGV